MSEFHHRTHPLSGRPFRLSCRKVSDLLASVGPILVGLAALIGAYVGLRNGQKKIQSTSDEIHVYVNSRMTEVVEYVKELKQLLEDNDIVVPAPIEHPASGAYQQGTGAHSVDTSINEKIKE